MAIETFMHAIRLLKGPAENRGLESAPCSFPLSAYSGVERPELVLVFGLCKETFAAGNTVVEALSPLVSDRDG
jgi:hypothetical protein